jgi:hypothetical protein
MGLHKRQLGCLDSKRGLLEDARDRHGSDNWPEAAFAVSTRRDLAKIARLGVLHYGKTLIVTRVEERRKQAEVRRKFRAARLAPEILMARTAAFVQSGGSICAWELCRRFHRQTTDEMSSTPSGKEMANMGKKIVMAAKRDLHVQGLPDGYGMDLGCIIELMIAEFEQEPVSIERARRGNGTLVAKKWEVGAERALSQQQNSGRLQPKYLISIKADSRQMTQAPATHQTEGCALLIPEGWVGELHCQSVYRNKTIFIYS